MTRTLLLEEAAGAGLTLSGSIEIESREAAREAAAQGLGLAIMSEGELVPDGRLAVLAIPDWTTEMEEWMICLKSRELAACHPLLLHARSSWRHELHRRLRPVHRHAGRPRRTSVS